MTDTSSDAEMLPCPFCGGPAEMEPWHGGGPDKQLVSCAGFADTCNVGPSTTGETPAEAIAAWNTRPTDKLAEAAKTEDVARLRKELASLREAIDKSVWHIVCGERMKRILVAPAAIKRIDAAITSTAQSTTIVEKGNG